MFSTINWAVRINHVFFQNELIELLLAFKIEYYTWIKELK